MKLNLELTLVALSAMIVTTGATSASALSGSDVSCDREKPNNVVSMSGGSDDDRSAYTSTSENGEVLCEITNANSENGKRMGSYVNGKKAYSDVLGTSGKQPEAVGGALLGVRCKGRGEGMICTGGGLAPVKSEVVVAVADDLGDIGDGYTGEDSSDGGRPDTGSSPVPEPTAALLFGAGLVVAGAATRRKAA